LIEKLKQKFIKLLLSILWKLEKNDLSKIQKEKAEIIGNVIHTFLNDLFISQQKDRGLEDLDLEPLNVIEGGTYNYFPLPSSKVPHFHFFCPKLALYIYIGSPASASYEVAKRYGISKQERDLELSDIAALEVMVPKLASVSGKQKPKLLVFNWEDPCTQQSVAKRIYEALNGA